MQLILREDVPHLGRRGQVVKVSAGYARNYLVPKRLAYVVTAGVQRQVDSESRAKRNREVRELKEAEGIQARLREIDVIRMVRRAGERGTLFGSVTSADLAEELARQGVTVDKRQIRLDEPIKRTGTHRVPIHVHHEISVEIVVDVLPDESGAPS